jgi:hypothetical protein
VALNGRVEGQVWSMVSGVSGDTTAMVGVKVVRSEVMELDMGIEEPEGV